MLVVTKLELVNCPWGGRWDGLSAWEPEPAAVRLAAVYYSEGRRKDAHNAVGVLLVQRRRFATRAAKLLLEMSDAWSRLT
jgi:hypothetical protein